MSTDNERKWEEVIAAFAEAIGKSVEEINEGLKGLVGDPSAEALALLENESDVTLEELIAAIGENVPTAKFRKAVSTHLRVIDQEAAATAMPLGAGNTFISSEAALPEVPAEEAWMTSLKADGQLKVEPPVVLSAIRTMLADQAGLFVVAPRILKKMEAHADTLSEPVGAQFFELEDLITKRRSARLLNALGGGKKFATVARKKALLTKLRGELLPGLREFYNVLTGWMESWNQSMGSTAALGFMMMSQNGGPMPPNFSQPPETSGLRSSAEMIADRINKVFAGLGIRVAGAMSVEAKSILEILDHKELPALIGAANKEQMLKELKIAVDPDFPRLEKNLVKFALAVMEFADVTTEREIGYLTSLIVLGQQINFDRLGSGTPSPVVADDSDDDDFDDDGDDEELVGAGSSSNGRWDS